MFKLNCKIVCIFFLFTALISCNDASKYPTLETVTSVNVDQYVGKWYEIASFPMRAQKDCTCTTAEYGTTEEGYITVLNKCKKGDRDVEISGKAFPDDDGSNSKLKVQFFPLLKSPYWIIDLAKDYSYAVVGTPNRKYLWILSRTPKMDENTYQEILKRVKNKEFDIEKLNRTEQNC